MYNGELVELMLNSSNLELGDIILAFASGSAQHGARIEGKSDLDVAGVYIGTPEFELAIGNEDPRKKGHLTSGSADQYEKNTAADTDVKAYTLRRWAGLAMKGNPVILSYLFVPDNLKDSCVQSSVWTSHILKNRDLFAASGHAAAFLGLGDAQYKRMLGVGTGKHGQRTELINEHGYDCYDEEETEFLTNQGWKRFDEISDTMMLAVFDGETGAIWRENFISKIDKLYTGLMYVVEPQLTRCVVTPGHNMVVSPASRNPRTGFSTKYRGDKASWAHTSMQDLMAGVTTRVTRSMYHIRRAGSPQSSRFNVTEEYLMLAGMFLSEGSISFRNERVKSLQLVQTPEGKEQYYKHADRLIQLFRGHRYDYPREHVEFETRWTFPREIAQRIYTDFGHHKSKCLPAWCYSLSYEQAWTVWNGMCLGDGYRTKNERGSGQGTNLYTSVKALADSAQAMMVTAGHICVVNGPYWSESEYGACWMYQVYRPDDQDQFRCVNFKSGILRANDTPKEKYGYPIKEIKVENRRVVCFEVPAGTLITRSGGRPAFQGNCKAAMHMIRSMSECLEFLKTGYMTFPRPDRQALLEIRAGKWTLDRVKKEYLNLVEQVKEAEKVSPLPPKCDRVAINKVVVEAMLDHWKYKGDI